MQKNTTKLQAREKLEIIRAKVIGVGKLTIIRYAVIGGRNWK